MHGKFGVSAAEACNEVVFEGANGTLSSIASVDVWGDQLEVDVVLREQLFEDLINISSL